MKMTMNIDEEALTLVMDYYGLETKTDAVDFALKEAVRKHRLRTEFKNGLGLSTEELANAVDPDYDLMALRMADLPKNYTGSYYGSADTD